VKRLLSAVFLALLAIPVFAQGPPGVVVEKVEPGGTADRAGIQAGDILLEWERAPDPPANPEGARGVFRSPFDLWQLEGGEGLKGPVQCMAQRGSDMLSVELVPGRWGLGVQPHLVAMERAALKQAKARVGAGDGDRGARWLLYTTAGVRDRTATAWLAAQAAGMSRTTQVELEAWQRAEKELHAYPASLAWVWELQGRILETRGKLESAHSAYHRALVLRRGLGPEDLLVARSLNDIGVVVHDRGDLDIAEGYYLRALEIDERAAPGSLAAAPCLGNLGVLAKDRGYLGAAESYYLRALDIYEKLIPGGLEVASSLNNLGVVARVRGDLVKAERYYSRAQRIKETLAPGSLALASSLSNLAALVAMRGDLEAAEGLQNRALTIVEELAPESLWVAQSFQNLGALAWRRGDLEGAEEYQRRAVQIVERSAPESLDVAGSLSNLGNVALDRGDLETAERHHRRALEIREALAQRGVELASSLHNLGAVAETRGDLEAATGYYHRALEICRESAPESFEEAANLLNLGNVARERGQLAAAEAYHRRALAILDTLAPRSGDTARAAHELGKVLRRREKLAEALSIFARAVDGLEAQHTRLGGSEEVRAGFRATHIDFYRDYIDALLEAGHAQDAFHVLERSRARGLLEMLAERDLVFDVDLPEELERERRMANVQYERTQVQMQGLSSVNDAEKIEELSAKLRGLRRRQDEIKAEIRRHSPHLAALQYPEALNLEQAQEVLDQGIVLLSWSLGEEYSHLFVLGPGDRGLEVYTLDVGEEKIRRRVEVLRGMVQGGRDGMPETFVTQSAESLSSDLLSPAEDRIATAERLVIVPDGPLNVLPFAALIDPGAGNRRLVETKPISVVASVTVLDQLKRQRRPRQTARLEAFGDPLYPRLEEPTEPVLASMVRRGTVLRRLPATRAEVESLGALFSEGASLWLGPEATEERATSVGKETSIVHFACHGIVDERFPLNSALALTIREEPEEGEANGLLQAWEIFERVRIDADLVTLSACETALGKEIAGEGIVGLTRAFQYAGARTVLASLWSVTDVSTAELMKRFYNNLKAGESKDVALQKAQLDFIRGPITIGTDEDAVERDLSHPFYWAAFQLIGDWQ
jgi:CHAT domain-containing protein/Tfp pilus assembly protein PilF